MITFIFFGRMLIYDSVYFSVVPLGVRFNPDSTRFALTIKGESKFS